MTRDPNKDMAAAVAAHQRGDLQEAERLYGLVLRVAPHYVPAQCYLGIALVQQGKAKAALKVLAGAASAEPSFEALSHYGLALAMTGDPAQALTQLDRALTIQPRDAGVLQNRGNVLKLLRRYAEAVQSYDRALAETPGDPQLHNNRGTALAELGRGDEALASYDRAIALLPNYADAHENRGNALTWLDRHDDAVASYRQALALRPDSGDLHYALSFALLRHGDCRAGFREYEWRLRQPESISRRIDYRRPLWLGTPPLAGKSILLAAEQGYGDTLLFVRYVPLVAAMGARVVLRVQAALKTLLASTPGAASVIGHDEALPSTDYYCPLPSLPLALGTELSTIPSPGAYVTAPTDRVEHWRARLPQAQRRVGIVWCGNPNFRDDRLRSMTLADVLPVLHTPDVAFVSLNPGVSEADRAALAALPNVTHLAADFRDFADTAAVLAGVDLLVSTDTAIVHLAGAVARPVWIMLATHADWRWLTGREDNPWYPTARLFRQPSFGDWRSVVARVEQELQGF